MADTIIHPWTFLDAYRGKFFTTKWPTFPQMITISADRFPNRPCFTDFDVPGDIRRTLSYSQVLANVKKLAKWMTAHGIRKGDKVAVTGKNSPEWGTVYLATLFASGIIVPIDYALHENELENLLKTAQPKLLFVDEDKFNYFNTHANGMGIYSLSPKYPDVYAYNLEAIENIPENPPAEPDDVAAILFTSGTTGNPKGVMLTHENFVSDCYIAQSNFQHGTNDVFYALLPIHHAYTMQAAFINPLSTGAQIVFGKSMAISRLMKELSEGQITVMLGVPLLYNKLLAGIKKGIREKGLFVALFMQFLMAFSYFIKKVFKKNPGKFLFKSVLEKANIYTLRVAISGGGPLSPSVFRAYNAAGINFIQGYGLTETSPIIALNPIDHFKIESVGKDFYPYEEIKILNPDKDDIGEICIKGPMLMKGYYNMPEETAKMYTEDGFLRTGDIGKLDNEHYLVLCGRAKNIIVTSGGKNVYPEEIEDAFQLYNNIQQIVVQRYIMNNDPSSEGIEALIYPSDLVYENLGISRTDSFSSDDVQEVIQDDVDIVNHTLLPYARISRVVILEKPMTMTTTLKVKRIYTPEIVSRSAEGSPVKQADETL